MKRNQLALHERALHIAAYDAYIDQVVSANLESELIGEGMQYESEEIWEEAKIKEWLERAEKGEGM